MEKNKNATPQQTGIFEMLSGTQTVTVQQPPAKKSVAHTTSTELVTADGGTRRGVNEKNLKKRLARLSASRPMLVLAILLSCSAVLTVFRGYYLPVTLGLTISRVLYAAAVWVMYFTAGKKGSRFLAALPLYLTMALAAGLVFFAVFIFGGMFGKMILLGGNSGVALVRVIYKASLWSIIPALACLVSAYCLYLYKRHERQLFCNIRDGLTYGFAFENGYGGFTRSAVIVAVLFPVLHIASGFIGPVSALGFVSQNAASLFDKLFVPSGNYYLNLVGILVHSASLIMASTVVGKYAGVVKKHKAQKEMRRAGAAAQALPGTQTLNTASISVQNTESNSATV